MRIPFKRVRYNAPNAGKNKLIIQVTQALDGLPQEASNFTGHIWKLEGFRKGCWPDIHKPCYQPWIKAKAQYDADLPPY